MNYLHYRFELNPDEVIEVALDKQANVKLMDEVGFSKYKVGQRYSYLGGLARRSPVTLRPPRSGVWHLVIDLGGYAGSVQASVRTRQQAA